MMPACLCFVLPSGSFRGVNCPYYISSCQINMETNALNPNGILSDGITGGRDQFIASAAQFIAVV